MFFFLAFFAMSTVVFGQNVDLPADEPPFYCPNTQGTHYQNAFPRYNIVTRSLLLVDGATGETVRTLGSIKNNLRLISWSPDCRYLSGAVGLIITGEPDRLDSEVYITWTGRATAWQETRRIAIWDTIAGERMVTTPINAGRYIYYDGSPVIWSPDSRKAIALGGCASIFASCQYERITVDYLIDLESRQVTQFDPVISGGREYNAGNFNQVLWDLEANRIWTSSSGSVLIYDLTTGGTVSTYSNTGSLFSDETRFLFSPDGTRLITYAPDLGGIAQYNTSGELTIHDLRLGETTTVNTQRFTARPNVDPNKHAVALSPNNRYLAAGYDAIRVWDLKNLPESKAERVPIYRHGGPDALITELRFVDDGIIETVSGDGVQKWDLHTGVYVR